MPVPLNVRLLGEVAFTWYANEDGGIDVPVAPASRKGTAVLVFLAMQAAGARREALAELLWGVGKLASVRQALYEIRKLPGAGAWLVDDGDVVRISAATDVERFQRALEGGDGEGAVAAYGGPFLGASPDLVTSAYHDWWQSERARLEAGFVQALRAEVERLAGAERWVGAQELVERWLALDPFDEAAHRAAIRMAHASGDLESAREAFRRCHDMLRREFGAGPSDATRALMDAIERSAPTEPPAALRVLTPTQMRLVQALAVAGGALGIEEISAVLDRSSFDVATDLESLERAGLLDAHLSVSPAHQGAVRASMTEATRRLLHGRTAAQLRAHESSGAGSGVDDGVVGLHLLAAGKPAEAAPRFVMAARKQVERADLDAATLWSFRALWAMPAMDATRLEACLLLEGLASQRGAAELQDDALLEAERLAWEMQADRSLAEVRMRRSRQRLRQGRVGEGLDLALEALEIALRLNDGALASRARNAVGAAHYFAGDLDGAATSFGQNVDADDAVERYRARNNLGSLAAIRGRIEEAYGHFEAALTLARATGQHVDIAATLNNLAATADRLGDYARAVKHFREGIALARRNAAPEREGQLLANLAAVYARQGQFGPAWNTAVEVEEIAAQRDDRRLAMHAHEHQAEVARSCGDERRAVELLAVAARIARDLEDDRKRLALEAQLATIRAAAGEGSATEAEAAIERLEEAQLTDIAPWLWLERALAAASARDAERCFARIDAAALGSHQHFVLDVALARASLLEGAGTAGSGAADRARYRLQRSLAREAEGPDGFAGTVTEATDPVRGGAEGPRYATGTEFAERPLARTVLFAHASGMPEPGVDVPADIVTELQEQAEGLPRPLRESLLAMPMRWLRSLGGPWADLP
ncbi:MAG: BTAD domain-containing putative transcriptional regulator [Trueperaceae bacterium]